MVKETRALWWGVRCGRVCRVGFICLTILTERIMILAILTLWKNCEINVVREWIEKVSVVDLEKEIPYTNYSSKRLYYNVIDTANRKSFEKHFVFFMKRIEKFLTVNASLRGDKAGLESTYQQRLFKNNAYRWLAQCRDIDFKNCEILDGILIDWIPKDLECFGRRYPYTKTEKQAMGKKLLDEIMDSIFNLKI